MSPSASRSGVAAPCFGDLPATLQGAQVGADLTATATGAASLHHRPGDTFGEVTTLRELGPAAGKRTADAGRLQHPFGLLPNTTPSGAGHPLPGADHTVPGAGLATVSGAEHTVPGAGPVDHLPSHAAVDPSSTTDLSGDHRPPFVPPRSKPLIHHSPSGDHRPPSRPKSPPPTSRPPSKSSSARRTPPIAPPRTPPTPALPTLWTPAPSPQGRAHRWRPSAPSDARTQGAPRGSATQATEDEAARSPVPTAALPLPTVRWF